MYIVFDTETNGKINYKAPSDHPNKYPRITQLAFMVFDENEQEAFSFSSLIKPDDWTIPKEKFFIDNNMSTERCEEEGIPLLDAIAIFKEYCEQCKYKIAHNISFDGPVIYSEFRRYNIAEFENKPKSVCTMKSSTKFCALPNQNGYSGYKWPKLEELHQILFDCNFDGAHDALADVEATAKCFFELVKRKIIIL